MCRQIMPNAPSHGKGVIEKNRGDACREQVRQWSSYGKNEKAAPQSPNSIDVHPGVSGSGHRTPKVQLEPSIFKFQRQGTNRNKTESKPDEPASSEMAEFMYGNNQRNGQEIEEHGKVGNGISRIARAVRRLNQHAREQQAQHQAKECVAESLSLDSFRTQSGIENRSEI